jgi:hypothetical protein
MKKNRRGPNNTPKKTTQVIDNTVKKSDYDLAFQIIDKSPDKYSTLSDEMQCNPNIINWVTSESFTVYAQGWGDTDRDYKKAFIPISSIPIENIKKAFVDRFHIRVILNKYPSLISILTENFNDSNMVYFADYFDQFSKDLQEKFTNASFSLSEKQEILRLNDNLVTLIMSTSPNSMSDKIELAFSMISNSLSDAMRKVGLDFSDNNTWAILNKKMIHTVKNYYNGWGRHVLHYVEAAELIINYGEPHQISKLRWVSEASKKYRDTISYDIEYNLKLRFGDVLKQLEA